MLNEALTRAFITLNEQSHFAYQQMHTSATVKVQLWQGGFFHITSKEGSSCGYIQEGQAELCHRGMRFSLQAGMYFSAPGEVQISGEGQGLLITQTQHEAFFMLGGPIEEKGRLQYIDGCTDSLLIAPPLLGDPCLNLLHIPPRTFQSQHSHPSLRAGMIVSGSGYCITPQGSYELKPGQAFVIPAEAQHSFVTQNEALRVIAYHPDSDFGPTHEHHPMINRTYLKKT